VFAALIIDRHRPNRKLSGSTEVVFRGFECNSIDPGDRQTVGGSV
jgi:hypothetical protein